MKIPTSIPRANITNGRKLSLPSPAARKRALVDLGAYALARGQWVMVMAITHIIAARGVGP
jgi:hypothetical protein